MVQFRSLKRTHRVEEYLVIAGLVTLLLLPVVENYSRPAPYVEDAEKHVSAGFPVLRVLWLALRILGGSSDPVTPRPEEETGNCEAPEMRRGIPKELDLNKALKKEQVAGVLNPYLQRERVSFRGGGYLKLEDDGTLSTHDMKMDGHVTLHLDDTLVFRDSTGKELLVFKQEASGTVIHYRENEDVRRALLEQLEELGCNA